MYICMNVDKTRVFSSRVGKNWEFSCEESVIKMYNMQGHQSTILVMILLTIEV